MYEAAPETTLVALAWKLAREKYAVDLCLAGGNAMPPGRLETRSRPLTFPAPDTCGSHHSS